MVSFVKIGGIIHEGYFIKRVNRFLTLVKIDDIVQQAFLPNPGKMRELLIQGNKVILKEESKSINRKTKYDLIGVEFNNQIVSIDSRIPNKIVFQVLRNKELKEFSKYSKIKPEYGFGHTRFDFFLSDKNEKCLLEVKSCTLVKEGIALFPDAITARGKRHVEELIKAKESGFRTGIIFIVQRRDATIFSANYITDPKFAEALKKARKKGVEVYAHQSFFQEGKILFGKRLKIRI